MSSILYKSLDAVRIPLVRYSARSKRLNKAEVQLLKDFPNFGVKGEIIKVPHSVMRNVLHRDNGASYILPNQGPKIPVVKPKRISVTTEPVQEVKQQIEKPEAKPEVKSKKEVKIDGLLLNLPQDTTKPATNITPSESLSLFKLSRELLSLHIKRPGSSADSLAQTLSLEDVADEINKIVSSKVDVSNIEIKSSTGKTIKTIESYGTYKLLIWKNEENFAVSLFVKAA